VASDVAEVRAAWPAVLAATRGQSRNVEALLREARPVAVEGEMITLAFPYSFHKQRIEEQKNKMLVEQVLSETLGGRRSIRCILTPKSADEVEQERPKDKFQQAAEDPVIRAGLKMGGRIADVQ
jgi:DNA polymerase-3 subunit gamma/tau